MTTIEKIKNYCLIRDEDEAFIAVRELLLNNYSKQKITIAKEYMFAEGDIPVCLVAHLDTVFPYMKEYIEMYYDSFERVMWSPQGAGFDDRAGVAMIDQILQEGYRPHIIFTTGEESGGTGSRQLVIDHKKIPFKLKPKFLIQLDRMGYDDCVFYCCNNKKFEKYINKFGFVTDIGTFTDISILMPSWQICGVNLSVGYYDEHTREERLFLEAWENTLVKVINILEDENLIKQNFKFHEKKRDFTNIRQFHRTDDEMVTCICCDKEVPANKAAGFYNGFTITYACEDCYKQFF